ncbi:Mitochondrial carrier protein [Popillia japonica]|uniref:Mitochondrial carrier protein n=1 Tax=Popillia japonica TaxID=7064 RepID=A0AAW1JXZ1_POPJA
MSKQKEVKNNWSNYAVRIIVNTASHPLEYAKVLIQLGYEPIPPRPSTTLFGKPALKLPNIFEYVKYIKSVDGFSGCYRGLFPKVCGNLVCAITTERVLEKLDSEISTRNENNDQIEDELDGDETHERKGDRQKREDEKAKFIRNLKKDLISRVSAIIISHPFHVITIRMMAQFVGHETKYSGLFNSVVEVYKQNGILGFFSGLVPRVIGDIIFLLLASTATYAINTYVFEEKEFQMYTSATMSFIASAITYPFQVVANCMAVSKSGLTAGQPPAMPLYENWVNCWLDLSRQNQLKRGSSLLIRYYVGPQEKGFANMFWKYSNPSASQLENILGKEDVTLQEVLDGEDLINECKYGNKALLSFLIKPDIMDELVKLTTVEPSKELDESTRFKYPNIACELLTCDVPALNERLASDVALLEKLCLFLDNEPPLNPLLASFFSKIMGVLIAKKTEQVLDFLKAKENFIKLLLNHLGTSAIMDLTLKLMTQVEGVEMRQNILNWLDSQRIIQSLVALLDPTIDSERHYNVAQLLCDFIKTARDNQRNSTERNDPDPLLNSLESVETISLLLDHILGGERIESSIVGGIQVLLAILDIQKICFSSIPEYDSQNIYNNSNNDDPIEMEERQKIMKNITSAILSKLKDFHALLLNPPTKAPINTTLGILDPPLGNTRLQVTKLIAAIIFSNNVELLQELASLGTMEVLLDLFFKYQWNNFLHTQVESCITAALKVECLSQQGDMNILSKHLVINCKLIERILEAWEANDEQQTQTKGIRKGYMGHLISILNKIVNACNKTCLGQFLNDKLPDVSEKLHTFQETTLSETNKIQETLLGGAHPNTSNEDSDDYGDIPFQQSGISQQQYVHYQMQQLNSQFIETYGFNDDDFNDGDDTLQTIDHRTGINFDLSEGDLMQQHELFKQVCAQNINTLSASDDQLFADRDREEATFQKGPVQKTVRRNAYSCDSDDDISPTRIDSASMDVDPWSSPNAASEAPPIISPNDPWGNIDKQDTDVNTGWADFSSVNFDNFDNRHDGRTGAETKKTVSELSEKEQLSVVETDLKLENIEINSNLVEANEVKKINDESIETVAQVAKDSLEEIKLLEASGDQAKADVCIVPTSKEIPLVGATKEGDTVPAQTGPSDETSKKKVIDKMEPNKEGV